MGYAVGYDDHWKRDVGYGVPAYCDHPGCTAEIDRGLGYICGDEIGGGERGCGLFFCTAHQVGYDQTCACCAPKKRRKFFEPSADHPQWLKHKLTDESWQEWRDENAAEVLKMQEALAAAKYAKFCKLRDEMGKPRTLGGTYYPKYSEREAFELAIKETTCS
jgi:hypothetical protein